MVQDGTDTPVPQVHAHDVRGFVAAVKAAGGWIKRHQLGLEERKARRLASVSRPVIVAWNGSPGYCHIEHVTEEELEHCIAAFRAVAKDATCTANLYEHALNKRRRKQPARVVQEQLSFES